MGKKNKPRSGSLAYYPRKRAKKQTPSFSTFPKIEGEAKPLNFYGYKAGMTHLIARDDHKKTTTFGQNIMINGTFIETPPLKVFGIRAYKKTPHGLKTLGEVWSEKKDKYLHKKILSLKPRTKLKKEKKSKEKQVKEKKSLNDLEKLKEEIVLITLLIHTQPFLTGIGKKKPEIAEIRLSGNIEQQLVFAKQKFGNEIRLEEVFKEKQFVDVKAVTKGKGFQGVVKRFGVKTSRPKAKKSRVVGSISPWNPSNVMWTVARPGQMGYHNRTEYNKRILLLKNSSNGFNPKAGFPNYGNIKNEFVLIAGSIPGPNKRLIALRQPIRRVPEDRVKISEISEISVQDKQVKK